MTTIHHEPRAYPAETMLTLEQLADWLQVSGEMADSMGFRCLTLGRGRKRRFLMKHILEDIERMVPKG